MCLDGQFNNNNKMANFGWLWWALKAFLGFGLWGCKVETKEYFCCMQIATFLCFSISFCSILFVERIGSVFLNILSPL